MATRTRSATSTPVWSPLFQETWTWPSFTSAPVAPVLNLNFIPCFSSDAMEPLAQLLVHQRQQGGRELQDQDLGAEPVPDGAELDADVPAAHDDQLLGQLGEARGPRWSRRRICRRTSGPGSSVGVLPVAIRMRLVLSVWRARCAGRGVTCTVSADEDLAGADVGRRPCSS